MKRREDAQNSYNGLAKGFHWLSALIVLGLLPLGFYMTSLEASPFMLSLYGWHKSFGTLLLFIVALRIVWRLSKGVPDHLDSHAAWEVGLAKIVHVLLYAGLIGMPVSGWLMTSFGQYPHAFFGMNIPPITPKNEELAHLMEEVHEIGVYALLAGIILHVAGAFKHHMIDRDITLKRMLPRIAPRLGAAIALFVFLLSMGVSGAFYVQHVISHDHNDHSGTMEESSFDGFSEGDSLADEGGDASAETIQSWAIDQAQSRVGFEAAAQGAAFSGTFDDFSGTILFDADHLEASKATVTVSVDSVSTGGESRDGYMMDEAWLNEEDYPIARFETESFTHKGGNLYEATGHLTLRGVRVPVTFPFTLDIEDTDDGQTAHAQGSFVINRLDYNVGGGDWADSETASHEIKITVAITATAQ